MEDHTTISQLSIFDILPEEKKEETKLERPSFIPAVLLRRQKLYNYDPDKRARRSPTLPGRILQRDLYFCQCCYTSDQLEVHHIHPIHLGGQDTPNNMITLCHECHKFAPKHPDDFYEYQKNGGKQTESDLGAFSQSVFDSGMDVALPLVVNAFYLWRMGKFISEYNERASKHRDILTPEEEEFVEMLVRKKSGSVKVSDYPWIFKKPIGI